MGVCQWFADDKQCFRPGLEGLERGREILRSPNFQRCYIEAQPSGCVLYLAHLRHGVRNADIGHDRQPAEIGDNLA